MSRVDEIRPPRVALLVATARGLRVLRAARAALPEADLTVVSFREEQEEPPFLDAIAATAAQLGARFVEAKHVGRVEHAALWTERAPDVLLAASWRYLVPPAVYEAVARGAYILHDSLLPAYRGFAPTVWAIVNGETETGISLIEMDAAADAGALIAQERVAIGDEDTIATVMERVTCGYERLVAEWLPRMVLGAVPRQPQDAARATYCCKRTDLDNRIRWDTPTQRIRDLIRAVTHPYPGAWTTLDGVRLTIWSASPVPNPRPFVGRVPGRIVEVCRGVGVVVLTGDGELLVREVQRSGAAREPAERVLKSITWTLQ